MIVQLQIKDENSKFFIDLISKLKDVVEKVNVIENGKLIIENENRGYFEIEDKNGVLHKIPNWTEDEFREIGLRSFFENSDKEDKILMKYQEENGFCKNVLAQDSEDVWNDV